MFNTQLKNQVLLKCPWELQAQFLSFVWNNLSHFLLPHHDSKPVLAVGHHSILPFIGGAR